jgi:hypothetical protein
MPYDESQNPDSSDFSIRIGAFYDNNWNVVWNISLNSTAQLPTDYLDYNTSKYRAYIDNSTSAMSCSKTNQSSTCYVDTTNNLVWIQIPHFSGVGPTVTATAATTTSSTSSGGGVVTPSFLTQDFTALIPSLMNDILSERSLRYK